MAFHGNFRTRIVENTSDCLKIVEELLKCNVIAVDAEGINLGKDGPLTLLQIGTMDGKVYLFDIYKNKSLFQQGRLRDVLESPVIKKVIQSCSGDSAALYFQFDIKLKNVFDTQIAHLVIEEHKGRKLPSKEKLSEICNKYSTSANVSDEKDTLKEKWLKEEGDLWARRPLTQEMINYAAGDITALIPEVYENQQRYIEKNGLEEVFVERVSEEINFFIDDAANKSRNERIDKIVKSALSDFERKYTAATVLEYITDEDDIKALQLIRYDQPGLPDIVKRLKAESMKQKMQEIRNQLTVEGDEFVPKIRSFGFLRAFEHHPEKAIATEAKALQADISRILLKDMGSKYTVHTPFHVLNQYEKEALRTLKPKRENDPGINSVLLSLYWQREEEEIDNTISKFRTEGKSYSITEGKYKWLKFVCSANVYPNNLKQKVKLHLKKLDEVFGKNNCPGRK